jgi:hypothetical protein
MSTEQDHINHNEEAEKAIIDDVEKHGCHFALIEADNYLPAFAFTIGLFQTFNHPEIICIGLRTELLSFILNEALSRVKQGEIFTSGKLYSGFLEGCDIQFLNVDKSYYPDYLGYCMWFNKYEDFPTLQLVFPDLKSKFPWEDDFNLEWKFRQKLLDRDADFKFYENRNLGVYTTKQILNGEPILYVYHNEDGDWQFHNSNEPGFEDAKLVSLEEIIKRDHSINKLFNLEFGWCAWRKNINDEWEIGEKS